jgi:glycosyltransferase involved in cell wall biosynthesis
VVSAFDCWLLGRLLQQFDAPETTVVVMLPWQWPAVARLRRARVVFDCADDWSKVLPSRAAAVRRLYEHISAEAASVVVNTPSLTNLFEGRDVAIVPNGTSRASLATMPTPPPRRHTLVYAGTLSERFDVPLMREVLLLLPDWSLALYGEYRFRNGGRHPTAEIRGLFDEFHSRVVWHGVVDRGALSKRLDDGDVLILPHTRTGAVTGDAMKLYDYAARGRPIVTTAWSDRLATTGPPHLYVATTAQEFASAIRRAAAEPLDYGHARRRWAESNAWPARWPAWSHAVFGSERHHGT